MVNSSAASLDASFSALANPTRRAILERLRQGPASVGELAGPFDMSLPAISKHVTVLEEAGLVDRRRVGRRRVCEIEAEPLAEATAWLTRYQAFWSDRLDALGELLADQATAGDATRGEAHEAGQADQAVQADEGSELDRGPHTNDQGRSS